MKSNLHYYSLPLKNELYIKYHDKEWCRPNFDEQYLFEVILLEFFQAGLIFKNIQKEYGWFYQYLKTFTNPYLKRQ